MLYFPPKPIRRKTRDLLINPFVSLCIGFGGDGRIFGGFFPGFLQVFFLKERNGLECKDLLFFYLSIAPR